MTAAATSTPRNKSHNTPVRSRTPAAAPIMVPEGAAAIDARLANLLLAAEASFSRKGFAATTMDDIAHAAGMSKKTLYKMFDSKSDLFRATLLRSAGQFRFWDGPALTGTPEQQLKLWLKRVLDSAFSPKEIALHRLIVGERVASPDFARIFSDVAFQYGPEGVIDCIKRVKLRPHLRKLPARMVAEMIIGSVLGIDHFKHLIDDSHRLDPRMLKKRIDVTVATFCESADGD
jgi:TetR/AcrR family transcriptional repressor of mexJK operon